MSDLKPCPFCGGKAELFHSYDGFHCVQCTVCYCSTLNFRSEKTAIHFWNRRAGEEGDGMSKPMSEQMQKLADRYEKATGKKFEARTNADLIRAMSDEELAEFLWNFSLDDVSTSTVKEWLQQPAEEDDHDERKENEHV